MEELSGDGQLQQQEGSSSSVRLAASRACGEKKNLQCPADSFEVTRPPIPSPPPFRTLYEQDFGISKVLGVLEKEIVITASVKATANKDINQQRTRHGTAELSR
ncbi:uncharacterized protein LOC143040958 [Oratosquilla oratoria]|uniref:uncharacterized protein LOC143040958 n=1 Tax=Oratosquilla oratoria TaxID=337810 RepID=UPI003F76130B